MRTRYFYRIERISHRPAAEDKITIIKDVREQDLQRARIMATRNFREELQALEGKYSPASFQDYEIKKGIGFNYQLLLVDAGEKISYVVESSMDKIKTLVRAHRNEEKQIFQTLGFPYSGF